MVALVTSDELETVKGLGLPTAQADALLDQASEVVRDRCGWHIAPEAIGAELTLDGIDSPYLSLPTLFLTDVTAVLENGDPVDLADITWSQYGVLERVSARWTKERRGIVATIDHGYAGTPAGVAAVVMDMVARASASPRGEVRTQTGPFSVTYSQPAFNIAGGVVLLPHQARALGKYILP